MNATRRARCVRAVAVLAVAATAAACGSSVPEGDPVVSTIRTTPRTIAAPVTTIARSPGITKVPHEVHAYYYPWYGNPQHEGSWEHWTHPRQLENGTNGPNRVAPDDPGTAAWPQLGLYSSHDGTVVDTHMAQMASAGIDVAIVSWYGQGTESDGVMPLILQKAEQHGIKVTVVMEPSWNSVAEFSQRIHYLVDAYGQNTAFYRNIKAQRRPVIYTYDPLWNHRKVRPLPTQQQWRDLLTIGGANTIRGTKYDSIIVAQVESPADVGNAAHDGMDAVTTYLANFDFSAIPTLKATATDYGVALIPSVGPGYDDTRIRPWNTAGVRGRDGGRYYRNSVKVALDTFPSIVAVTSFNEWHEGTQIEPAVDHTTPAYTFPGYAPLAPDGYLTLTHDLLAEFKQTTFP